MEESLERIREWVKESQFSEAEKALSALILEASTPSLELLQLHAHCLLEQRKTPSAKLLLMLAELEIESDVDKTLGWLSHLSNLDLNNHYRQVQFLKIKIADKRGQIDELHHLISEFQVYLYEKRNPSIPILIKEMIEKYFRGDFSLKLQHLSLTLMLSDLESSERILKELFLSTLEKASAKGLKNKISAIDNVLEATFFKGYLEVYSGLCLMMREGVNNKISLKKLVEFIIYTKDFKFQVIALDLMHKHDLQELAWDYAVVIKNNSDYDFVYFEKYYIHLKSYFAQAREKESLPTQNKLVVDLSLDEKILKTAPLSAINHDTITEEIRIINLFKYQDYSDHELFEIAVSFLQSELPNISLKAVERILAGNPVGKTYLKASYLRLTCLLLLGDNRAAVDCALSALDKAYTQDDILSFLYGEAEAYIRLGQNQDAKRVLREIISIDSKYRLTKERLEKLDEI